MIQSSQEDNQPYDREVADYEPVNSAAVFLALLPILVKVLNLLLKDVIP